MDPDHVTSKSGLELTVLPDQTRRQPDDAAVQLPVSSDVTGHLATGSAGLNTQELEPLEAQYGIVIDLGFHEVPENSPLLSRSSARTETVPMRAMVVTGAVLSLLAIASSIFWAVYKFKPGLVADTVASPESENATLNSSGNSETSPIAVSVGNGVAGHRVSHAMPFRHNAACQTILSESNAGNAGWDGFLTLGTTSVLTSAGSGVAGLSASGNTVIRGTQTDLVAVGLGCPSIHISAGRLVA